MAPARENEGIAAVHDPARDFLDFWRNYFEQTAIQTRLLLENMQGGKGVEQLHHQWLDSLSQSLDTFMRTPAFLEVLKQTLKRMIELKNLQDQMTQSVVQQTGVSTSSDVAGIVDRIQSAEQTIMTRLAAIEDRLGAIETEVKDAPAEPQHTVSSTEQRRTVSPTDQHHTGKKTVPRRSQGKKREPTKRTEKDKHTS
jgi:hypothetical protein